MKKTKIVQEIIGEAIKPHGFEFLAFDAGGWVYEKKTGDLRQRIVITLMSEDETRLTFSTNAYMQRPISAGDLVQEGEERGDELFGNYTFYSEEEFVKRIEYFKYIILKYGFDALERISVPTTEIRPTKETNLYLYENHKELNKRYRKKFGIDENTTTEEIFQIVYDYILETQGEEFEVVKETLIGLTAVVGTVMVEASKGGWEWEPEWNICWVIGTGKDPRRTYLFNSIISCWRKKAKHTVAKLKTDYNYILKVR